MTIVSQIIDSASTGNNDYFTRPDPLEPQTKARSVDINGISQSVNMAFNKMPSEQSLKGGTINYAVDTGTVDNAYVAAINSKVITYFEGLEVVLRARRANTGPSTLNVNGIGPVQIVRVTGATLGERDIEPLSILSLRYVASINAFVMPQVVASDIAQTAEDRVQTGLDRIATGQDRAATGLDRIATGQDVIAAQAIKDQIATGAAFSDSNPIVRNAIDVTKQLFMNLAALATGQVVTLTVRALSGTIALLSDLTQFITPKTYFNSNTNNALNLANGGVQRWAPAAGTQTLTITGWPPAGTEGWLRIKLINGGGRTINWPAAIQWIKSDGSRTSTFSLNGVVLQTSGTDEVILFTDDGGVTIAGKIIR